MPPPTYKSIYFRDHPGTNSRRKALTLAVGAGEPELASAIRPMSSHQIRSAIGFSSYSALAEAAASADLPIHTFCVRALKRWLHQQPEDEQYSLPHLSGPASHLVTFSDDRAAPFQRWFPLLEGYSLSFVELLLSERTRGSSRILDPFGGVGTTPLAASLRGSSAFYAEVNPALQKVTRAKFEVLARPRASRSGIVNELRILAERLPNLITAAQTDQQLRNSYDGIFHGSSFFADDTLDDILALRRAIDVLDTQHDLSRTLLEVAALASLQPASFLIRAGDLRYRTEAEQQRMEPYLGAVRDRLLAIADDIEGTEVEAEPALLVAEDARQLDRVRHLAIDGVVTSPPYLNGTNYIRNTKLELWFIRALKTKVDLRGYRDAAITAGINDVRGKSPAPRSGLANDVLSALEARAYDSRIPRMVSSYLSGMSTVFDALALHVIPGSPLLLDIGDSAYAGVHVPTDRLLAEVAGGSGFRLLESEVLRTRMSRTDITLSQKLLTFEFNGPKDPPSNKSLVEGDLQTWQAFKRRLPHQQKPYSKRNWGNARHSMCSYQGKMKPSLAHHLVDTFVPSGGRMLDPFAGVGTIPFEACLTGRQGMGFEISPAALAIMTAKLCPPKPSAVAEVLAELEDHIDRVKPSPSAKEAARKLRFNRALEDYFHPDTFEEILSAREYFQQESDSPAKAFVLACLLHILHGNRPYALSRRSHPITPFAPTGPRDYRALTSQLAKKVERMLNAHLPDHFVEGESLLQDATEPWPASADEFDAVITSPPFYDSTRFYLANWMRLWFCGWEHADFAIQPRRYIDERQKRSFDVYEAVLRQARERLKQDGVLIMHLGKSRKRDMADALAHVASPWFRVVDRFDESVTHTESHGIRDKGTVTSHQYLVLA